LQQFTLTQTWQLGSALCIFAKLATMGGNLITYEPGTTALLELYPEAYQIFLQAGWVDYFRRLPDFNTQQVLEFACNLREGFSIVQGVQIPVTEEVIAQVSRLPTNGMRWFSRKYLILNAQQDFLQPGEQVEPKGRGVTLQSLPPPWPKVAEFVKQYLTCKSRYQVIYQHDFVLLNHLTNGQLINMHYYLLGCLKNMSRYTINAKHPLLSLKHHHLAQLLINRGFALNHPPPLINPLQQREENPQEDEEIPQQDEEIPQQDEETPQQDEEIPQQAEDIPQQSEKISQEIPQQTEEISQQIEQIP